MSGVPVATASTNLPAISAPPPAVVAPAPPAPAAASVRKPPKVSSGGGGSSGFTFGNFESDASSDFKSLGAAFKSIPLGGWVAIAVVVVAIVVAVILGVQYGLKTTITKAKEPAKQKCTSTLDCTKASDVCSTAGTCEAMSASCTTNMQCPIEAVCSGGSCIRISLDTCTTDSCPSGSYCDSNSTMCLRQNACAADSDCLLTESCNNNVCVANPSCSGTSTATCYNNTDFVCQSDRCARVVDCEPSEDSGCPIDATCVGTHPVGGSDICQFIGGCEPGASPLSGLTCPAGATCSSNLNVCTGLVACSSDSECNGKEQAGLAYFCATTGKDAGYCVGSTQSCTSSGDCPSGSICSSGSGDGVCVRDEACDIGKNDCGAGFVCVANSVGDHRCAPETACSLADPDACPTGFVCATTTKTGPAGCAYVGTCENGVCLMGATDIGTATPAPNPFGVCTSTDDGKTCPISVNCNDVGVSCPTGFICDTLLGVCSAEVNCSADGSGACPTTVVSGVTYDMLCEGTSCAAVLNCDATSGKPCAANMRCVGGKGTDKSLSICQDVQFDCSQTSDCPAGFICAQQTGGVGGAYCVKSGGNCEHNTDCNSGYYCHAFNNTGSGGVCVEVSANTLCAVPRTGGVDQSFIACGSREGIPLSTCAIADTTAVCKQCTKGVTVGGVAAGSALPVTLIDAGTNQVVFEVCVGKLQELGGLSKDTATCSFGFEVEAPPTGDSFAGNLYHRMQTGTAPSTCALADALPAPIGFMLTTGSNTGIHSDSVLTSPMYGAPMTVESGQRPAGAKEDLILVPMMFPEFSGSRNLSTLLWFVPALEPPSPANDQLLMPYYVVAASSVGISDEQQTIDELVWVRDSVRAVSTFSLTEPDVIASATAPYNMAVGSGAGLTAAQTGGKDQPSPAPASASAGNTKGYSGQQAFITSLEGFETTTDTSAKDLLVVHIFDSAKYLKGGVSDATTPFGLLRGTRDSKGVPKRLDVSNFKTNPTLSYLCGMTGAFVYQNNGEPTAGLTNGNYKTTQNITRLFWADLTYQKGESNDVLPYWDTLSNTTTSNMALYATLTQRPFPYAPMAPTILGVNSPDLTSTFSEPGGSYMNLSFAGSGYIPPHAPSSEKAFSYSGRFMDINHITNPSAPASSAGKWDPRISLLSTAGSVGGKQDPTKYPPTLHAICG